MKKRKHTSKRQNHWNPKIPTFIKRLLMVLLITIMAMAAIDNIPEAKADSTYSLQNEKADSTYLATSLARIALDEKISASEAPAEDQPREKKPSKAPAKCQVEEVKLLTVPAEDQLEEEKLSEALVEDQNGTKATKIGLANAKVSPIVPPDVEPIVAIARCTAYCPGSCCNGKWAGVTASGAKMEEWHTVAGTRNLPFGTIVYIPYFANWPNGGWFVVQDRFGEDPEGYKYAFDILMGSHDACNQVGKRELEVYIYM